MDGEESESGEERKVRKPVVGPVTIWIGVFPGSTSATAAHDAAQDVLALLRDFEIIDVDVDFRESFYRRKVAGPQLLRPVSGLSPLFDVVSPITSALGLHISTRDKLNARGTMALYLAEGGNSDKLLGLSCRHVLIGSDEANISYDYHPRGPHKNVILLCKRDFNSLIHSIKVRIGRHGMTIEHSKMRIEMFKNEEASTNADKAEQARRYRIQTERLVDKAENAIDKLEVFLRQVKKEWNSPNNRVLGPILHSPAIGLGVSEHRFTEDWGIFEVEHDKLGDSFQGNKMDLGML